MAHGPTGVNTQQEPVFLFPAGKAMGERQEDKPESGGWRMGCWLWPHWLGHLRGARKLSECFFAPTNGAKPHLTLRLFERAK